MGAVGSKPNVKTSYIYGGDVTCDDSDTVTTIPGCLQHFAETIPDKNAIVFCSTVGPRRAISWKEMYDKSYTLSKSLINLGVKPGEKVVVISRSCPEYLYAVFGAMMAAASVVNLVFTYVDGSDFIAMMHKIGDCAAIILDPGLEECNWRIMKSVIDEYSSSGSVRSAKIPVLQRLIFIHPPENEHVKTIDDLLKEKHTSIELPEVNPQAIAIMFQTSGSTGLPKLVCHTHASFVMFRHVINCEAYGPHDIFFNDRPFSWMGGFMFGVLIGQTRVTISGFCPAPADRTTFVIDLIQSERCTIAGLFPGAIDEILQRQEELPADWPLKTIWTGGQPITKSVAVCVGKICKYLGLAYGGTEFVAVSSMVVANQDDLVDYASGHLLPGIEVKIVGEDGAMVPIDERGEIYVRTRHIFKGYLNDPKKTSEVMTSDGWYKTDDYGRLNADGYLFIDGRISDMIISGAMNVMPSILEAVMKACPGVESAVVVPVPDKKMYQTICACVTIEPGHDVTEAKIRDYMESIHNDKQNMFTVLPRYYMIIDKLPEETNGKISRKTLQKMAEERFAS